MLESILIKLGWKLLEWLIAFLTKQGIKAQKDKKLLEKIKKAIKDEDRKRAAAKINALLNS